MPSRGLSLALAASIALPLLAALATAALPAQRVEALASIGVNSRVWYGGGRYYADSYGGGSSGYRAAQWVTVTYTSANKYKYHIATTGPLGWTNDVRSPEATFKDWDGKQLKKQVVSDKTPASPPANPSRAGYTFTGWTSYSATGNSDQTITAQYRASTFTVRFLDWDGRVISSQTVTHGGNATLPTQPSRAGYTFAQWSKAHTNITANTDITAQYIQIPLAQYTVTFLDWDGAVLKRGPVVIDTAAVPPPAPSREGYIFTGWDADFSSINADLAVTALYEQELYEVSFYDGADEGTAQVVETQFVTYGEDATEPAAPLLPGYRFNEWDGGYTNITSDISLHAMWLAEIRTIAGFTALYRLPDSETGYTVSAGSLPAGMEISYFYKDYLGTDGFGGVGYWQIVGTTDIVGDHRFSVTNQDNGSTMDMVLVVDAYSSANLISTSEAALDEEVGFYDAQDRFVDAHMSSDNEYIYFHAFYIDGVRQMDAAEHGSAGAFMAEPGSTKITIFAQTVKNAGAGSHTFCAEFRTPAGDITRSTTEVKVQQPPEQPRSGGGGGGGPSSGSGPTITVKFVVNGGTPIDSINVLSGFKISSVIKSPTREGYTFGGWFKDAMETKPFDVNEVLESGLTLYAKWIEDKPPPVPQRQARRPSAAQAGGGRRSGSEPAAPEAPALSASGFADVFAKDWFAADVDWAYENKLMIGTSGTTFEPDGQSTGGMAVTVLARLAKAGTDADADKGADTDADADAGTDERGREGSVIPEIAEGQWYTPFAKWAYAEGLLDLTDAPLGGGAPGPLRVAAGLLGVAEAPPAAGAAGAAGAARAGSRAAAGAGAARAGSRAAAGAGEAADAAGLLADAPFDFDAIVTREEVAVLIARFLANSGVEYAVTAEYVVFSDEELISAGAMDAFQTLFKIGIFKGVGDNAMEPGRPIIRAELAALLRRIDAFIAERAEAQGDATEGGGAEGDATEGDAMAGDATEGGD